MNSKSTISLLLMGALCFTAGLVIGRRAWAPLRTRPPQADEGAKVRSSVDPFAVGDRPVGATLHAEESPKQLAVDDVMAAIRAAVAEPSSSKRQKALQKIINSVAVADIPKVLTLVETVSNPDIRSVLITGLLPRWAESRPVEAMAYAQSLSNFQRRTEAVLSVAGAWALADGAAAAAWLEQLPAGQMRSQAANTIISALAGEDPEKAFALAEKVSSGSYRYDLLGECV